MAVSQPTAPIEPDGPPVNALPALDLMDPPGGQYPGVDLVAAFEAGRAAPAAHPDYLGESPRLVDGRCTLCRFEPRYHLDGTGRELSLRDWHRVDAQRPNGFFADEPFSAARR